jgi:hypothetical protein
VNKPGSSHFFCFRMLLRFLWGSISSSSLPGASSSTVV